MMLNLRIKFGEKEEKVLPKKDNSRRERGLNKL